MNPNNEYYDLEASAEEAFDGETSSDEDFFRELEEKEKDLDISPELVIEVDESDFDEQKIPEFLRSELALGQAAGTRRKESAIEPLGDNSELEREVSRLRDKLAVMESERAELAELARRRLRDFESYKNRVERDRSETFSKQICNLATEMLPVLDNLNRALDSASEIAEEKQADIRQFFDGIVLVNQQVNEVFAGLGVQPIPSVGEDFDPHLHEAVAIEVTSEFPHNTVSGEMLRGYRIGDRVIRHSMVKVAAAPAIENHASGNAFSANEDADGKTVDSEAPSQQED